MVMPWTPTDTRASRTSSSLNGLMMAVISFMGARTPGEWECPHYRQDRPDLSHLLCAASVIRAANGGNRGRAGFGNGPAGRQACAGGSVESPATSALRPPQPATVAPRLTAAMARGAPP